MSVCYRVPPYKTGLKISITGLFKMFSVDFSGLLPALPDGMVYVLGAVKNLTGWPIVSVTLDSTLETVIEVIKEEIVYFFGPPKQSSRIKHHFCFIKVEDVHQ